MSTHVPSERSSQLAGRGAWAALLIRLAPASLAPAILAPAIALAPASTGATKPPAVADDAVDVSAVREKLRTYTDGRGHYLVLVPFELSGPTFFYGDGKNFYAQRGFGGGRNGEEFNRSFWEPRVHDRGQSMFAYTSKRYTLTCADRETIFTPLASAESAQMVLAGRFHRPLWKRQSYWLARDDKARFYFVDRMREPEGNHDFRLFVGPKGNLKQQKMMNVVSDTRGDIFSTKSGQLRLVSSSSEGAWHKGKAKTKLTVVPIEDNHVLVYTDLGVYTGERLGTPCDDL